MKANIFIFSASNRLLRLLSIIPVSLNKDSDAGGGDKYFLAMLAKTEKC